MFLQNWKLNYPLRNTKTSTISSCAICIIVPQTQTRRTGWENRVTSVWINENTNTKKAELSFVFLWPEQCLRSRAGMVFLLLKQTYEVHRHSMRLKSSHDKMEIKQEMLRSSPVLNWNMRMSMPCVCMVCVQVMAHKVTMAESHTTSSP